MPGFCRVAVVRVVSSERCGCDSVSDELLLSRESVNQKVVPCPGVLVRPSRPPIMPTSCFTMASPSPVPPYFLVIDPSACEKESKIFS